MTNGFLSGVEATKKIQILEHTYALAVAIALVGETLSDREPAVATALMELAGHIQADSQKLMDGMMKLGGVVISR